MYSATHVFRVSLTQLLLWSIVLGTLLLYLFFFPQKAVAGSETILGSDSVLDSGAVPSQWRRLYYDMVSSARTSSAGTTFKLLLKEAVRSLPSDVTDTTDNIFRVQTLISELRKAKAQLQTALVDSVHDFSNASQRNSNLVKEPAKQLRRRQILRKFEKTVSCRLLVCEKDELELAGRRLLDSGSDAFSSF